MKKKKKKKETPSNWDLLSSSPPGSCFPTCPFQLENFKLDAHACLL
jgi:hypothetical protein